MRKLKKWPGEAPTYMRPPYGRWDQEVKEVLDEKGMELALWTTEQPSDWEYLDEEKGCRLHQG